MAFNETKWRNYLAEIKQYAIDLEAWINLKSGPHTEDSGNPDTPRPKVPKRP